MTSPPPNKSSDISSSRIAQQHAFSPPTVNPFESSAAEEDQAVVSNPLEEIQAEFIATVSHELRTPLTVVLGFITTLLEESPGPLTETQREFLLLSYQSSKQLEHMITTLLDVAHLEHQSACLPMTAVQLTPLFNRLTEKYQRIARQKKITLTCTPLPNPPPVIEADRQQLEKIITHLLNNAIKFTPEKGHVILSVHNTYTGQLLAEQYLAHQGIHLQIQDTGIGIPGKDLSDIFNRFYRGSNIRGKSIKGTGLGLYITRQLVKQHHGYIWAESNAQDNTILNVWLPVTQPPATDNHSPNQASSSIFSP